MSNLFQKDSNLSKSNVNLSQIYFKLFLTQKFQFKINFNSAFHQNSK
jgi:hypothetical protein